MHSDVRLHVNLFKPVQ